MYIIDMPQFPLDVRAWSTQHVDNMSHAVGNACIWKDPWYTVMLVRGPNRRRDFHTNPTPEIFYQVTGTMTLRVMCSAEHAYEWKKTERDIVIGPGELYILPPGVPHQPRRPKDSLGIVIEHTRQPHELDAFEWYCPVCNRRMHRVESHMKDLGAQLTRMLVTEGSQAVCVPCRSKL